MKPATIKHISSAGGILFRKKKRGVEIALIAVKDKNLWTIPKGTVDKDENVEDAAIREIREETGLTGRIVESIGEKSYWFYLKDENIKYRKTVMYFLLEYAEGTIEDTCIEVDDAQWFLIDDAVQKVTYRNDKDIIAKARDIIFRKMQETV